MHLNKQQRYERALARREGQTAHANGLTLDRNPYDVGTDCHCQWDVGYEEAAREPQLNFGSNFQTS
jgi:hypothetical protein